jgi:retinol dehydrogenase-12/retinol dehydrogenase-13
LITLREKSIACTSVIRKDVKFKYNTENTIQHNERAGGLYELEGKVCIVTGSNSGIGKETALSLSLMGATVVMAVRNLERGEAAKSEIISHCADPKLECMTLDLLSNDSIKSFVREFNSKYDRLDVLINNAGAGFHNRELTVDGFEKTFAVNFIGPFLLTHELLPLLKNSAPSRIINLTSGLHSGGKIDLNDLQYEHGYKGMQAYRNAKLMTVLYTYELSRRLEGTGVTTNVVHPGFAASNLMINMGGFRYRVMDKMVRRFQITVKEGAETSVHVASSPDLVNVTGKYFVKKEIAESSETSYDRELQQKLWMTAEELLGIREDNPIE